MTTTTINQPLRERAEREFQADVWAWLAPLIAFAAGAGAAEATQQIVRKATGTKLPFWARLAVDLGAGGAAWLVEAGRRLTPAQKERKGINFDRAKSIRGHKWSSDLRHICGIAFDDADVKAMAFFGLPPEAIDMSAAELEAVITQRRITISQQYTGATQEVLLAGCNGFANRVRQLHRMRKA